eukprot:2859602-Amphidinium_carterae.1
MVVRKLELLLQCAAAVDLLGAVSGLTLSWRKTKVLPLGFASMEAFMERFRASTTSGWDEVSVVASLRFLGYMVERGDVEMDSLAATKILARAQAIELPLFRT